MKEQFATYEIALKLKELGFDEKCLAYYHNQVEPSFCNNLDRGNSVTNSESRYILYPQDCSAPLWQQAIDWFREKHNINVNIYIKKVVNGNTIPIYEFNIFFITENRDNKYYGKSLDYDSQENNENFIHYDKAREIAILKAIELCKNQ